MKQVPLGKLREETAVTFLRKISDEVNQQASQWRDNEMYLTSVRHSPLIKDTIIQENKISSSNNHKSQPQKFFRKKTQRKFFELTQNIQTTKYKSFSLTKLNEPQKKLFQNQLICQETETKPINYINSSRQFQKVKSPRQIAMIEKTNDAKFLTINRLIAPNVDENKRSKLAYKSEKPVPTSTQTKLRCKISHKFMKKRDNFKKQSLIIIDTERTERISSVGHKQSLTKQESLRKQLQSVSHRRRKSVASLLRSLFDSQARPKYYEKNTVLSIKSARFLPQPCQSKF